MVRRNYTGTPVRRDRQKERVPTLINEKVEMVLRDMENAEVFNEVFDSVFTVSQGFHGLNIHEFLSGGHRNIIPLTVSTEQVQDNLISDVPPDMHMYISMGPSDMYARVLKEQAVVVAKACSIIFENSWLSGDILGDCKKGNITLIFKK